MSSRSDQRAVTTLPPSGGRATALFAAAGMALLAAAGPAWAGGSLAVCVDRSSPSVAMDRKVAQAVAQKLGDTLAFTEFDGSGDDDGFDLRNFVRLANSSCDLILGFPVDATTGAIPKDLMATPPYARVSFVLATAKGLSSPDLAHLPNGTDVAVTYLTTPNLYFEAHPNVSADVFKTEDETLHSLVSHDVKAALLWRPTIVKYQLAHPAMSPVAIHELTEAHARWNIVALYADRGAAAAARFAAGIDQFRSNGSLDRLVGPYAVAAGSASTGSRPAKGHVTGDTLVQPAVFHASSPPPIVLAADVQISPPAAKPGAATALPALYTQAQATAGQSLFAANCSVCHGKDLSGMAGPALKGRNFASVKADFKVGDVFKIVSQNMPATQPGVLPHDVYVNIMAFLLQQNGYPAGAKPLDYKAATVSNVPLLYHGD